MSEVTKNKLNKFQYQPQPEDSTKDSEADAPSKKGAVTPVARLTWRDLIEPKTTTEDDDQASPNDALLWDDNRKDAHYIAALSPMLYRRGRKRARSSSPVSSPAADQPTTPAVNVRKIAQALKSPHPDPTLELWDRYTLKGPQDTAAPLGISNPALAQLMVSSSPRTTKGANAEGDNNLRRAISCGGLNWPKRRRMEKSSLGGRGSGEIRSMEAAAKSSLVTQLLDTVTSSFHGQSQGVGVDQGLESPSPKKRRLCATSTGSPRPQKTEKGPPQYSSDYGDDEFDEFDDDTLMELEASINATQLDAAVKTPVQKPPAETDRKGRESNPIILDEFDDLDDDLFDGAENLVAAVESQHISQAHAYTPSPKPRMPATTKVNEEPGDLDDEFGDAFGGDFDFEAVELAATQAVQQSNNQPTEVRREASDEITHTK